MKIDQFTDVIKNCRFCFMCRHLSGVGNVTFTESDTPRIRASMIYGATMHPEKFSDPDFIAMLYRSDLSAACRFHCVNHFDENGLNLAARADIVARGQAPDAVRAIAERIQKTADWTLSGSGEVLYFEDPVTAELKTVSAAFAKVMKKLDIPYQTIRGGCIGKSLSVLGFQKEAADVAKRFASAVNASGAGTLVVSNPAAYDALVNDFPAYGIKVNPKVMHSNEFLVAQKVVASKKLPPVFYLESDYLRNYNNDLPFPRALLKQLNADVQMFGTNNEESYSCGEGAVVLAEIAPGIVEKLAHYVEERADHPTQDLIVVASPYTKKQLEKFTVLHVKTLEELVASCL